MLAYRNCGRKERYLSREIALLYGRIRAQPNIPLVSHNNVRNRVDKYKGIIDKETPDGYRCSR